MRAIHLRRPATSGVSRWLVIALTASLVCGALTAGSAASSSARAASPCSNVPLAILHVVRPADGVSLYTASQEEISAASRYGFTDLRGVAFYAAPADAAAMTAVHRLHKPANGDFVWIPSGAELDAAVAQHGYIDQGRNFAAATVEDSCLAPVRRYAKDGVHRFAVTSNDQQALTTAGWIDEGVRFYAGPPPSTTPPATPTALASSAIGSLPVGQASYPVPAGAVHVAPGGNDASAGTSAAPVRTLARGVALAPSGGTVVLHAGRYRETVTIGKTVTIQNAPGEAAWLDGSAPVTGWVRTATGWRKDGWTTRFDHSPTYTKGAPDGPAPYWQFVSPSYPMAAHPDQVWIDGVALKQVGSLSQLGAGKFFLDESMSRLHIGSDPTGRTVEASTLSKALSVRAGGTVIRGIGIRRYAPSVWMMAAVTLEAPSAQVENVVVEAMATTGISVLSSDVTMRRLTVRQSGMLGIHGRYADRLRLTAADIRGNNVERFNHAPVAGGIKIGRTRGVTVRDSSFSGNLGHGFWIDMSVYNTTFANTTFRDNDGNGLFLEISAKATVVDNLFSGNGEFGIKVNNTSDVKVWNNTFVGNSNRPLNIVQDLRRNTDPNNPAVDPRLPWPDPAMLWTLGPVTIANNVVGSTGTKANCVLCVEDYSHEKTAEQMRITANSNVYHRSTTAQPTWLAVWSRGAGNPSVYTTLAAFRSATGQERLGREFIGAAIVDANGVVTSTVASLEPTVASPLPTDVAAVAGRIGGERHLGLWR
ncbi:MAG: right-handed parallel beta-helix repeat-containing protein [Acidimicrobiia bacterium]|nr:right-handed parallel beta-helix repeat-containing protein [Acidimicrobiia bacterium]